MICCRYAQSPSKEDSGCYRQHLTECSQQWVQQLSTMGLPASIMADAHVEAASMVDDKVKLRSDFSWSAA